MSARKLLLLSLLVLLLFAFIFLFERRLPSTSERQQKGDLHWDLPEDRVQLVRLEHSGGSVELKKEKKDSWRLTQPEPYPADSFAVSSLVSELADLKRSGGESADPQPEKYGLSTPSAKATIVWSEEKEPEKKLTRSIEFGIEIPGTDATAARVAGSERILFVPTSTSTASRRSADEFKSKDVFTFSAFEVAELDLMRGSGRLLLAKRGGTWRMKVPIVDLAEGESVEKLAGDLTALRAQEFLSHEKKQDLSALGLSPPLYRVTLADAKGSRATVELGATRSDAKSVYARKEGQVFTLESSIVEDLSQEAGAFRGRNLVHFERVNASALEGAFGEERFSLTRKEGNWSVGDRAVLASAADDLLSSLLDLKSKSFLEEAEAKRFSSRQPLGVVTVSLGKENPWVVRLFPRGEEVAATVSGRPGGFLLPGDGISSLQAAFRKATAPPVPTGTATPASNPP